MIDVAHDMRILRLTAAMRRGVLIDTGELWDDEKAMIAVALWLGSLGRTSIELAVSWN